jgi:hypothetical protein
MNHSPRYEHSSIEFPDGFANNVRNNSSGSLENKIQSLGREKIQEVIAPLDFDMNRINSYLERREEVIELHELLERAIFSLERNNNAKVASSGNGIVNYDDAINYGREFVSFCDSLISKYDDELDRLRYSQLEDTINGAKKESSHVEVDLVEKHDLDGATIVEVKIPENKFKSIKKETPQKEEGLNLDEENNRKISDLELSDDMLKLSCDDLFMFGIIEHSDLDSLTPVELSKVIDHVSDLRELAQYSDMDKARKRAEWPRIEFGKQVIPQDVTESEIQVQKLRDNSNGRKIYERINSLFGETPKL